MVTKCKPTVVHCHDTFALPSGWVLKIICNSKLVYDAHELESDKNGQNYILRAATLLIENICWSKIDLFVSVSDSIINWYINKFGFKPNVLVLNSPVYDENLLYKKEAPSNIYLKSYFNIPFNIPIFVYLGILSPGRGIEASLEAFSELEVDAHVIFIGSGPLEGMIKNFVNNFKNIHHHPPVKHFEVVPLVSQADYGICLIEDVSLSDRFSLPNKLFEYAFAGLSVIASDLPEIRNLIFKHDIGVCCTASSDSIKAAVKLLIQKKIQVSPSKIQELGWDMQEKRLLNAYSGLLN